MPVEAKPQFRPDALRPHLQSFPWPSLRNCSQLPPSRNRRYAVVNQPNNTI